MRARFEAPSQPNVKATPTGAVGTNSALPTVWGRGRPVRYQSMSPPDGDGHRVVRTDTAGGYGRGRGTYVRRQPGDTVLHQVVREHLETFLAEARRRARVIAGDVLVALGAADAEGK